LNILFQSNWTKNKEIRAKTKQHFDDAAAAEERTTSIQIWILFPVQVYSGLSRLPHTTGSHYSFASSWFYLTTTGLNWRVLTASVLFIHV
jgi:hypothetical protein